MPDDTENLNRPPPDANDTDEAPALPDLGLAEAALARALQGLSPTPAAINRDRLIFAAGAASRTNTIRLWQFAAGILAAVGFAAGMYFRPPVIVVRDADVLPAPIPVKEHLPVK